jgi:hypothetical protein
MTLRGVLMQQSWQEIMGGQDLVTVDAALATFREWLKDHEMVVVPREATANMLARASLVEVDDIELTPSEYRAAWQAMIAAAPDSGLEGETGGE